MARTVNKTMHNLVSTGIDPVILQGIAWITLGIIDIIDYIPRTKNFPVAKQITVIPVLHGIVIIIQPIILQHFPDFCLCKAKRIRKKRVGNGHNLKIVQPSKNALPRNPQAAGQYRKKQVWIRFQRIPQKATEEGNHFLIVRAVRMICFIQWYIVLVNQDYYWFSIIGTQETGHLTKGVLQGILCNILACQFL